MSTFWKSEWPREWELAHRTFLKVRYDLAERIDEEDSGGGCVWTQIFGLGEDNRYGGGLGLGYLHCRTCYFDEYIEANAADCAQLVILGAGFDSRCYRLELASMRCFELDVPTTQGEKREALAEAGVDASHVTFVPVDFALEDWFEKLKGAGFDPSLPTLFLWEGVTYYLTDAVVQATFARIASCPRTLVAYDVYYKWFSIDPRTVALMSRGYGEPFQSGVERNGEGGPTESVGMTTLDVVVADEANRRYVPRDGGCRLVCPAFGGFAMVIASTQPTWNVALPSSEPRYATEPLVPTPAARGPQRAELAASGLSLPSVLDIVSGLVGGMVDADQPLMAAGVDSLLSVELAEMLQTAVGDATALPSTLTFDYPSARELSSFVCKEIDAPESLALTAEAAHLPRADAFRAASIAGLSTLKPSGAGSKFAGPSLLSCRIDLLVEVPGERWSEATRLAADSAAASRRRHGGFALGLEQLDHSLFLASVAEASTMDPQQRVLLERGYEALHASQHDRASLLNSSSGVFLGIQAADYTDILRASPAGETVTGKIRNACSEAVPCALRRFSLCAVSPCTPI